MNMEKTRFKKSDNFLLMAKLAVVKLMQIFFNNNINFFLFKLIYNME